MSVIDHIIDAFESIGSIADGLRKRVRYIVLAALVAAGYIAYQAYGVDSSWWWNAIKCGLPILPVFVWLLIWSVLGQIGQAPEIAKELVADRGEILQSFSKLDVQQVTSLRGAYQTLRSFREHDELEEVMETIGGIGLLINPLFALLALISFFGLFCLILAALLLALI